ncbi:MAG: NBR1-Ig-like domain-containing protein [Anaerolineales bacterium]|jgi:hypothetical protein
MRCVFFSMLFLLVGLINASCKLPAPGAENPTATDPSLLFTSSALTSEAYRMGKGDNVPTLRPDLLIKTHAAPTLTFTPAGTRLTPTLTPAPTNTPLALVPTASEDDRAEFLADVSVPDKSEFMPGEMFTKTWKIKNSGNRAWTTGYSVVFIDGDLMGGPASFQIPRRVPPGDEVEVSVELAAPYSSGSYRGNWKLKNAAGEVFGVSENGEKPFWVDIVVSSSGTPQFDQNEVLGSEIFTELAFFVDQSEVENADCPHTFTFRADFELAEDIVLTYQLEAYTPEYLYEIKMPPPLTRNLKSGSQQVVYELEFDNNIRGWARLVFLEPEMILSPEAHFSLTCR